ncbi:biotin/acetyl-CoA-carboxylase ligase domain protein [Burkholderia pseudomallei]|nr:biotin/acetyl-CoA-carboxylase ligase domain protein [Burkholderia pseudomallei]
MRTLTPKPITTAVASIVFQTVSISTPASLPTIAVSPSRSVATSRSFGHLSTMRRAPSASPRGASPVAAGSAANASASAAPTARLSPASAPTGRGSTHATEQSSASPGFANHGRPCRPRPAVCSYATRAIGAASASRRRGSAFRRAPRSALVEPVVSTISIDHSRAAGARCASTRARSMSGPPVAGMEGGVATFMARIVAELIDGCQRNVRRARRLTGGRIAALRGSVGDAPIIAACDWVGGGVLSGGFGARRSPSGGVSCAAPGAAQCNAVQCDAMRCDAVRCGVVWRGVVWRVARGAGTALRAIAHRWVFRAWAAPAVLRPPALAYGASAGCLSACAASIHCA